MRNFKLVHSSSLQTFAIFLPKMAKDDVTKTQFSQFIFFKIDFSKIWMKTQTNVKDKHVSGSQPPFSLIPYSDQNKEDTSTISVVGYGVYIPCPTRFNSVLYQTKISTKLLKILQILRNPLSRIRVGFCQFAWGSNHFIEKIPYHITHYNMDNQAQYSEAP